jgi:hypothetical protein
LANNFVSWQTPSRFLQGRKEGQMNHRSRPERNGRRIPNLGSAEGQFCWGRKKWQNKEKMAKPRKNGKIEMEKLAKSRKKWQNREKNGKIEMEKLAKSKKMAKSKWKKWQNKKMATYK